MNSGNTAKNAQLEKARAMTRELESILIILSRNSALPSEHALDLLSAARDSTAVTRTLLRHAIERL